MQEYEKMADPVPSAATDGLRPAHSARKDVIIITHEERKSQWERLLDYLIIHGSATSIEIQNKLYILNYKGRISDLRKKGYTIRTEQPCTVNGERKPYARYHLKGAPRL